MIAGKTKSGFEYSIDERIVKSYRYVRAAAKLYKGNKAEKFIAYDEIGTLLLGDKVEDLIKHLEGLNGGYAPFETVVIEINEIIEACSPKNSSSSPES